MSPLWLLPLGVGAVGAVVLALLTWRVGKEATALRRAIQSLQARAPAPAGPPSVRAP